MGDVTALGYLGLTGSLGEWQQMAGIIGLRAAPASSDGEARFRIDERAWRIAVEDGDAGLGYLGWEVGSSDALSRVRDRLAGAGVAVKADPELAAERGVLEVFSCQDPSGFRLEFFYGAEVSSTPFVSPIGARFVTSSDGSSLGLGHVVLLVDNAPAATDFYLGLLGFQTSDSIVSGFGTANFTHINARHHSLAIVGAPAGMTSRLDHFMLEVDDLDVVGGVLDRVTEAGVPVTVTLGKHSNDWMTSFYLRTPSGCDLEYGVGGRLVDDSWVPGWFRSPSIWGHRRTAVHAVHTTKE